MTIKKYPINQQIKKRSNRKGFTLLELSLYLTLLTIIGGILTGILWQVFDIQHALTNEHQIRQSFVQIDNFLDTQLKNATAIEINSEKNQLKFKSEAGTSFTIEIRDQNLQYNNKPLHNPNLLVDDLSFDLFEPLDNRNPKVLLTNLTLSKKEGFQTQKLSLKLTSKSR